MTTIAYLDQLAASAPGRAYKRDLLAMMDLRPGQTVLDIGCGPGTDLADLSDGVAPSGTVIGLDHDPAMADQARLRLADRTNVEIRVGDAHAMPLDDGTVDRARTDRMLQHVPDPGRVLAEFRRVARPGAGIAMAEPDWHGLLIDSPAGPGLVRYITTEVIRNPAIGRSLARLAEQAGLTVRTATVFSPVIRDLETAEQLFGLSRTLSRAVRAGYLEDPADLGSGPFLASCALFMVVADAP
ncbi:methyltransferase domain-containing protein [Nonomuraea aurantiaca]|uniref:methyltransferase domain-containing protein n=1 Tax=Nonomuraea aurantiaca TaxID=2878562 RepID=UPI001CD99EFE|nr:methyltransferase domain-containing protein [Nonomuraea aurantiaca]MCA2228027.1 methyltransferase domain-containing protein [Nonomuraea aurantiaca]